jgi:serine/threonine-protein kinase
MARLTTTAPPIRAQRPDVPIALDDVVHKCLARDPARRYASAADARAALASVRPDTSGVRVARPQPAPPAAAPRSTPKPTPRPAKARPAPRKKSGATWFWVVVVFLLAIAGVVAAFVIASS